MSASQTAAAGAAAEAADTAPSMSSTNMWCLASVMVAVIVLVVFIVTRKTDVGQRAKAAVIRMLSADNTPGQLAFDNTAELDESLVKEGDYVLWYFPQCGWCQKFKKELLAHKEELAAAKVRIHTANVALSPNNAKFSQRAPGQAGVPHLQRRAGGPDAPYETCEVPLDNGNVATGGYIPWEFLGPFMLP